MRIDNLVLFTYIRFQAFKYQYVHAKVIVLQGLQNQKELFCKVENCIGIIHLVPTQNFPKN